MTIEQYLKYKCRTINNPRYVDRVLIGVNFQKLLSKEKVTFIPIYSTGIYPRIVNLDSGACLFWDNHFWNIYEHYLRLFYLSQHPFSSKTVCLDKAAALNSIILSNLLDPYPSLALAFASLYLDLSAEFGLYDKKFYLTNLPEQAELDLILSQVYVFVHELTHNRLKNKPSVYQNIINGFVNEYKLGELPICESENDKRFEDTFRTFEKVLKAKNTNIIEELTCDFVAALETMDIAMKTVVRFYNVDYAVNAVVNTVTKINYFQSWLRQLQMNWSIVYKNWKKYPQNIFPDHYMDGIPAPIYSETSVRVGLLVSMINEYFTKIYGCNDYARVVSTDIFDISSQHMFKYNFVSKILNMEDEYRRNLSAVEARSKRDFILKWK